MTQIEVSSMYSKNKEFKEYVDKYAQNKRTTAEVVLKEALVHNVAEYYSKKIPDNKDRYSV
jgi:hypothetical protein